MRRAAIRVSSSPHDADDAVADATLALLETAPGDVQNPEAYATTITKRRAVDRIRAQRRSLAREVRYTALACPEEDFTEVVARRDEADWVAEQCEVLLKPVPREILLRVAEDEPVIDIARSLGITERSVESHLLRARRTMRSALARTLAGLLAGFDLSRRQMTAGAVPMVAAAAASLVIVALPHHSPEVALQPTIKPSVAAQEESRPSAVDAGVPLRAPVVVKAARANTAPKSLPAAVAKESTKSPVVTTSIARVTTYEADDGHESENVVVRYMNCLENLSITTTSLTCRDEEPAPY